MQKRLEEIQSELLNLELGKVTWKFGYENVQSCWNLFVYDEQL